MAKKTKTTKKTKKTKKTNKTYTPAQRAQKLQMYHEHRRDGRVADAAARMTGVSYITLRKWEKAAEEREEARLEEKIQNVVDAQETPLPSGNDNGLDGPRLVTPDGFTIYASVDGLIELVKKLEAQS